MDAIANPVAAARAFLADADSVDAAAVRKLEPVLVDANERGLAQDVHVEQQKRDGKRANQILSSAGGDPPELLALAKRLAADRELGVARRLLLRARTGLNRTDHPKIYLEIFQKSALYTYKDPDLPLDWRLNKALEILGGPEDLAKTTDCETLGLAGGIHKRKWEVDSGRHHLERALFYYLRGYAQGAPEGERANVLGYLEAKPGVTLDASKDRGYTGINAAFLLDLLASQEEEEATRAGMHSEAARQRRRHAQRIRREVLDSVPSLAVGDNAWLRREWWFYATIGEAHFGLGRDDPKHFAEAVEWLVTKPTANGLIRNTTTKRCVLDIPDWEYESTARQLARLSFLQGPAGQSSEAFEASEAGTALKAILQQDDCAVRSAFEGKFGLALSGGGFRASLFHIGVLACLAEHGVLPRIEVLSCVSGGSIVGAHFYLEVRHLLQTHADGDLDAAAYVRLVERLERAFLTGVQRNIRTRVLAEWTTNLKMIFVPGYSRTLRVGELYERELFRRVEDGGFAGPRWLPDWLATRLAAISGRKWPRKRWLNELFIRPKGHEQQKFVPRTHNWRRQHKVPTLILNATTLNSGHGWQFTASFMGEPPTPINTAIDANDRLRRMYYDDAPEGHKEIRLGHAVAASSCVPGLFEPLILDGLFPGQSVRLIDGGVCDNQGGSSLLEQDCTVMIVSDASGQMDSQPAPAASMIGVPLRANAILQARVREAQYADAAARQRSLLLRGLMFLHLKQDLPAQSLPWTNIPSSREVSDFEDSRSAASDETPYGIATATQRRLAAIRTDLDSFSDVEAFALMASGYQMAKRQLQGASPALPGFSGVVAPGKWRFQPIYDLLSAPAVAPGFKSRRAKISKILDAGGGIAFKVWKLSRPLFVVKWTLAAAIVTAAAWAVYAYRGLEVASLVPADMLHATFGAAGLAILSWIGLALLAAVLDRVLGERYGSHAMKAIQWRETLRSVLVGLCMATGGFVIARVHLHVFDRLFLRIGRLERLPKN